MKLSGDFEVMDSMPPLGSAAAASSSEPYHGILSDQPLLSLR